MKNAHFSKEGDRKEPKILSWTYPNEIKMVEKD